MLGRRCDGCTEMVEARECEAREEQWFLLSYTADETVPGKCARHCLANEPSEKLSDSDSEGQEDCPIDRLNYDWVRLSGSGLPGACSAVNPNTTTNAHSSQIYFALCTFDTDTPLSSLACKYSALLPCLDTNSALFSPGAADAYTAPSSVPLHPSSFTTSSILLT